MFLSFILRIRKVLFVFKFLICELFLEKRKGEEYGDKVKVTFPFETFPQKMRALGKYER